MEVWLSVYREFLSSSPFIINALRATESPPFKPSIRINSSPAKCHRTLVFGVG
jgi:hypothetical protein